MKTVDCITCPSAQSNGELFVSASRRGGGTSQEPRRSVFIDIVAHRLLVVSAAEVKDDEESETREQLSRIRFTCHLEIEFALFLA